MRSTPIPTVSYHKDRMSPPEGELTAEPQQPLKIQRLPRPTPEAWRWLSQIQKACEEQHSSLGRLLTYPPRSNSRGPLAAEPQRPLGRVSNQLSPWPTSETWPVTVSRRWGAPMRGRRRHRRRRKLRGSRSTEAAAGIAAGAADGGPDRSVRSKRQQHMEDEGKIHWQTRCVHTRAQEQCEPDVRTHPCNLLPIYNLFP